MEKLEDTGESTIENRLACMTMEEKLDAVLTSMWGIQEAMAAFVAEAQNSPLGKMLGIRKK
jgi:hypothetical protein